LWHQTKRERRRGDQSPRMTSDTPENDASAAPERCESTSLLFETVHSDANAQPSSDGHSANIELVNGSSESPRDQCAPITGAVMEMRRSGKEAGLAVSSEAQHLLREGCGNGNGTAPESSGLALEEGGREAARRCHPATKILQPCFWMACRRHGNCGSPKGCPEACSRV
jgi:hypothetical protein